MFTISYDKDKGKGERESSFLYADAFQDWIEQEKALVETVIIGSGVTGMGSKYGDEGMFDGCKSLSTITVDEKNPVFDSRDHCNAIIKTDENILVRGCKSTTIPESVKTIGEEAFLYCSGLKSINIPTGVTEIGSLAFSDCNDLNSVYLSDGLLKIGNMAFYRCKNLRSVRLPASITEIEGNFLESSAVDDIVFCGTQKEWENVVITEPAMMIFYRDWIEERLRYHDLVKTEKVPAACATDGAEAYWTCSACGKMYQKENVAEDPKEITAPIVIPATVKIKNKKYKVTAMSAKSLKGVQAKTIVVGNNVKIIGNSAMENCKKLTNITLGKNVTKIGKNAFKGIHSKAKVKVPAKKYSAYKKLFKSKGQGKKVKIVKVK